MARVTVEDCTQVVQSRFELVLLAAQRARALSTGAEITIDRDKDKDAVVALREIAGRTVSAEKLREMLVRSCQEKVNVDEYGVEEVVKTGSEYSSDEILEEITTLHPDVSSDEADSMFYGEEDVISDD